MELVTTGLVFWWIIIFQYTPTNIKPDIGAGHDWISILIAEDTSKASIHSP